MRAALDALAASVASTVEAVAQAAASLAEAKVSSEDMPLIAEQIARANETVGEIDAAVEAPVPDREAVFVMLHRLNNQLTGVLSLTMLLKDDLGSGHPSSGPLDRIDSNSRDSAARVKTVAAALRARKP